MKSRSRLLSMGTTLVGMMWAIGCGERGDNPLFAGDGPDAADGNVGAGGSIVDPDGGDDGEDASVGGEGGQGGAGGAGGVGGMGGGWGDEDAGPGGSVSDAGGDVHDAAPDVCSYAHIPGPFARKCRPPTENECDGLYEDGAFPNGLYGNGLDDDCDGIVDEGCSCGPGNPVGTTRACYLVPPSQIHPANKEPVGWCAGNAKGTMACVSRKVGEFTTAVWDGYCKGAAQPFADDVCSFGDYDCDGRDANSQSLDCLCDPAPTIVRCPTAPVVASPYPDPSDLTKKKDNPLDPSREAPFVIDGRSWIVGANPANATNWRWSIAGGDCDNVLPHPTFAIYDGPNATTANRIGIASNALGNGRQTGFVVGGHGSQQHRIFPAFTLSGDYVIRGEFDLEGRHHACSVKVQSRWPGLRAELCWDTVGNVDIDLHLARLQGTSCANHGWFSTCSSGTGEDCHYLNSSGCKGNSGPNWGYAVSADEACKGWGSQRASNEPCFNPRLDRDNIACNRGETSPLNGVGSTGFCAAENINIDNPDVGDMFAIGVHHYSGTNAHPRVNIYCNGERMLASGYDPTTTPSSMFPFLSSGGGRASGDFWSVARVTWLGDTAKESCKVEPIPSQNPRADRDGSSAYCVDTGPRNGASGETQWHFMSPSSSLPTGPTPSPFQAGKWFCWH